MRFLTSTGLDYLASTRSLGSFGLREFSAAESCWAAALHRSGDWSHTRRVAVDRQSCGGLRYGVGGYGMGPGGYGKRWKTGKDRPSSGIPQFLCTKWYLTPFWRGLANNSWLSFWILAQMWQQPSDWAWLRLTKWSWPKARLLHFVQGDFASFLERTAFFDVSQFLFIFPCSRKVLATLFLSHTWCWSSDVAFVAA